MDQLVIEGGVPLNGTVNVGGAKNAALPILFATILSDKTCELTNVPDLADIETTFKMLNQLGVSTQWDRAGHKAVVEAKTITNMEAPYELVRTMRASVLVLGPLLTRFGKARVSLPGGCSIGARPVNLHLMALEKMGAKIEIEGGYINAVASKLKGNRINFPTISVGATENTLMAAALADGETIIENAAMEPEIVDLANFLIAMGVNIEGAGTATIKVQGTSTLKPSRHSIIPDRIEAGTYVAAAAITGGTVQIPNVPAWLLSAVLEKFRESGVAIDATGGNIKASLQGAPKGTDITTKEFPGFPTDMQAQFMAAMTVADGTSIISENIFENRFMHVPELIRLGADITIQGNSAVIRGKGANGLSGATVMATDLRASASLVLGGLAARGSTTVRRIYHLDRGYEKMEEKLSQLGARIQRRKE